MIDLPHKSHAEGHTVGPGSQLPHKKMENPTSPGHEKRSKTYFDFFPIKAAPAIQKKSQRFLLSLGTKSVGSGNDSGAGSAVSSGRGRFFILQHEKQQQGRKCKKLGRCSSSSSHVLGTNRNHRGGAVKPPWGGGRA